MAAPDDEPPRFELLQFELPESPEHEDTTGAELSLIHISEPTRPY